MDDIRHMAQRAMGITPPPADSILLICLECSQLWRSAKLNHGRTCKCGGKLFPWPTEATPKSS
jgi:DNA-directed RNA polymerase subunit RPC12/RpoP